MNDNQKRVYNRAVKFLRTTSKTGKTKSERDDICVINSYALIDQLISSIKSKSIGQAIVCKKGCGFCCHTYQPRVTTSEIRYIQRYMRDNGRLFIPSHADDACPLLDDEDSTCLVYPVRPIICRGWMSRNSEFCESPPRSFVLRDESTPISFRGYLASKSIHDALCFVTKEQSMPIYEAIGKV